MLVFKYLIDCHEHLLVRAIFAFYNNCHSHCFSPRRNPKLIASPRHEHHGDSVIQTLHDNTVSSMAHHQSGIVQDLTMRHETTHRDILWNWTQLFARVFRC